MTIPGDSTRTTLADSIPTGKAVTGFIIEKPVAADPEPRSGSPFEVSFVTSALFLLFCLIGLQFRNDRKYAASILRNITEVRSRNNVFNETVHETLFLVMLNILWTCCTGCLLYSAIESGFLPSPLEIRTTLSSHPGATIGICTCTTLAYACFMTLAYYVTGNVFSDKESASMWMKGYAATQGFLGLLLLPPALMAILHPGWSAPLLWVALILFVIAKIVFIWKGFRIFFTQISSWVLFLYYLCSLEAVPLIITYLSAIRLCGNV